MYSMSGLSIDTLPSPSDKLKKKIQRNNDYFIQPLFMIGMTKIKISSQNDNSTTNGNDFVERRRASLERYLKRTAQHPILVLDPDFRQFLESG